MIKEKGGRVNMAFIDRVEQLLEKRKGTSKKEYEELELLSVEQVREIMGVSREVMQNLIYEKKHKFPVFRVAGKRRYKIPRRALYSWMMEKSKEGI